MSKELDRLRRKVALLQQQLTELQSRQGPPERSGPFYSQGRLISWNADGRGLVAVDDVATEALKSSNIEVTEDAIEARERSRTYLKEDTKRWACVSLNDAFDHKGLDFLLKPYGTLVLEDDQMAFSGREIGHSIFLTLGAALREGGDMACPDFDYYTNGQRYSFLVIPPKNCGGRTGQEATHLLSTHPTVAALIDAANVLIYGMVRTLPSDWLPIEH